MYPENTTYVYDYCEARVGGESPNVLFFGLQYILKKFLEGSVVEPWMINEARDIANAMLGNPDAIPTKDWQIIAGELGGFLPIKISAVAEGKVIPEGNVLFTIENTDPRFPWLPGYIETILMKVWYPTTVATRSYNTVSLLKKYFEETSDLNFPMWQYMLHDFGARAVESEEAAQIGGAAHIVNSLGSDTVAAVPWLQKYYSAGLEGIAATVPASEHSIACSYGPEEGETKYITTLMERFPDGILSIVADTYSITNFVENTLRENKDAIIKRSEDGKAPVNRFVVRPDSPRYENDTPQNQVLWLHESLGSIFGYSTNSKGYKVLHPAVGVIYGDGLSSDEIKAIYQILELEKWSVESCVVGQGGGLLQKLNRDTQRFAIKASYAEIAGKPINIRKNPADITKTSKAGKLSLIKNEGKYITVPKIENEDDDLLKTVYSAGS